MLKKITILIITCLFAMTALSGCTTEKSVKNMIEEALEKRYGEEFVCHDTWYDNDGAYYTTSYYGLCSPKDNPDILFEVLINDEGNLWRDEYASVLASRMLSKLFDERIGDSLGIHYTYCYNYGHLYIDDDETWNKIANKEFTLDYFLQKNANKRETNQLGLYFYICIDISSKSETDYKHEYEELIKTLNILYETGDLYGLDVQLYLETFFIKPETYNNCIAFFNEHSDIDSSFYDIIEKNAPYNEPQCMIKMNYKNGEFSITQENYIQKRKEIDNNVW